MKKLVKQEKKENLILNEFYNLEITNYNCDLKMSKTKFHKPKFSTFLSSFLKTSFMALILLFIYIPIFIMMLFAFNDDNTIFTWAGFGGFQWFVAMFQEDSFVDAFLVTMIVSISSTFFAVIIGTMAAIGLHYNSKTWYARTIRGLTNYPIFIADVIIASSLFVTFLAFGIKFGLITLIFANIMVSTPFVIITLLPKLNEIDSSAIDASFDLGASSSQTLFKIIIPLLIPSIIAGAAIAFSMSFDDFVLAYFLGGDVENISTWIYNLKKLSPIVNAFSVILIIFVAFIFMIKAIFDIYDDHKLNKKKYSVNKRLDKFEKEIVNELWFLYNDIRNQIWDDVEIENLEIDSKLKNKSNQELIDYFIDYSYREFNFTNEYDNILSKLKRQHYEGEITTAKFKRKKELNLKIYQKQLKKLKEVKINKIYLKGIVKSNLSIKQKINDLYDEAIINYEKKGKKDEQIQA